MKKSRVIIALVSIIAVLAVVLFASSIVVLKKAKDKNDVAQATAKEVMKEAIEQEKETEEEGEPTPEPTLEPAATIDEENTVAGITFTPVDDMVSVVSEGVRVRSQPTDEADQPFGVAQGRMLTRSGVSDKWSRVDCNGIICYIENQYIEAVENSGQTDTAAETSAPSQTTSVGKTVIIDPGHQGHGDSTQEPIGPGASQTKGRVTSGTSGCVSGLDEYQLNLIVALQLRDELVRRGYTVYMTRETHDINISNRERAEFATQHGGDILVRIHANGSESSSVSGALTMAPTSGNSFLSADLITKSQALSQYIIDSYVAATGFNNQGVYQTDEMSGINWSTMPVTIVEMGYMSNPSDDAAMADSSMQVKMVAGISDGIDQYFAAGN